MTSARPLPSAAAAWLMGPPPRARRRGAPTPRSATRCARGRPPRRPPAAGRWCGPTRTGRRGGPRGRTALPARAGRGAAPRGCRPAARVVPVDEHAGSPHRRRQAADGSGDHGRPAGLGLDGDEPERLVVRGHGHQVGGAVPLDELGRGDRRRRTAPGRRCRAGRRAPPAWGGARPVPLGPPRTATTSWPLQLRVAGQQLGRRGHAAPRAPSAAGSGRRRAAPARPAGRPTSARAARWSPGVNSVRSTPGGTTRTRSGSAPYSSTSSRASSSVLATSRSAASTTCASPISRPAGSGVSPSASWAFLTRAIVCMVCTSGTRQRSAASQPTCPESQ